MWPPKRKKKMPVMSEAIVMQKAVVVTSFEKVHLMFWSFWFHKNKSKNCITPILLLNRLTWLLTSSQKALLQLICKVGKLFSGPPYESIIKVCFLFFHFWVKLTLHSRVKQGWMGVPFPIIFWIFCQQLLLVLSFFLSLHVTPVVCGRLWNLASHGAMQAQSLCT